MTDPDCLFCRIIAGDIPAERVHEDDLVVAIDDINPVAPIHQLLMPRQHIASAAELTEDDGAMLGRLFAVAAQLARTPGSPSAATGWSATWGRRRPVRAHLHVHLVGGRRFAWPPG